MWKGCWEWSQERTLTETLVVMQARRDRCAPRRAEGLCRVGQSTGEHTRSAWPRPQSGSQILRGSRNSYGKYERPLFGWGHSVSPPDWCRQMDLNYTQCVPELSPRGLRCGGSAVRTSGMGPGLCLRGTLAGGVNSFVLRCHSRTLQNEGQSTSRVFGFYQPLEKNSTGSIPAPLEDTSEHQTLRTLLWGRTQMGKLEPALSCSRRRWTGGLKGTEGGGPRPSATCQIEGQR